MPTSFFRPVEGDYTDDDTLEAELNSAFNTSIFSGSFPMTAAVCGGLCGSLVSIFFQGTIASSLPSALVPIPTFAPLVASFLPLWGAHRYFEQRLGGKSFLTYFNTAVGIGVVTGCGILEVRQFGQHLPFGIFACCLGFYHMAEFGLVARYNPSLLSVDSFLGAWTGLVNIAHLIDARSTLPRSLH